MSGGKRPYHHGDLPRALVDASLDLVDRQGVDGFSLRAAARGAGVNPSAVYRHFTDRAELLGAVAAAGFADLGERMTEAVDGVGDPRSRFRATGEAYVRSALDRPDRFRLMFGPYGSLPGSAGRLTADTGHPGPYALLVGVLDDLAQAGDLDGRPEDTALTVWSTVHGLATLLVDRAVALDPADVDTAVAHLVGTVLRGLAP